MSKRAKFTTAYFASMLALALVQLLYTTSLVGTWSSNAQDIVYTLLSQIIGMGLVPFTACILLKNDDISAGQMMASFNYRAPKAKTWLVITPLIVLMFPVTIVFSSIGTIILNVIGYDFVYSVGTIYNSPADLIKWIAVIAVLPAVFEEFTHRGLLIGALRDRGSEMEIVVISALMFALMHTNIVQFFYAFAGGLVMGYVVVKTGSILPSMLMHFTNNAVSCIINYSSQTEGGLGELYDWIIAKISSSYLSGFMVLILAVAIIIFYVFLLSLLPKLAGCPKGVKEKSFFGGKIKLDTYHPDGKATLRDNKMLYVTIAMQIFLTVSTLIWGYMR